MKVSDLKNIEEIKLVQDSFDDIDVVAGYTSDLLSDVMANAVNGSLLITIQAHKNTIAVCKLLDMKAVIICNNRETDDDFLALPMIYGTDKHCGKELRSIR
jgi:hypothetical protein